MDDIAKYFEQVVANANSGIFDLEKANVTHANVCDIMPLVFHQLTDIRQHQILFHSNVLLAKLSKAEWRSIFDRTERNGVVDYYICIFFLTFHRDGERFLLDMGMDGPEFRKFIDIQASPRNWTLYQHGTRIKYDSRSIIYKRSGLSEDEIARIENYGSH